MYKQNNNDDIILIDNNINNNKFIDHMLDNKSQIL